MQIKAKKIREGAIIPIRASDGAVGYDVFASVILDRKTKEIIGDLPMALAPGETVLIGIGVQMAVPFPYQCETRPRSGLETKYDIRLFNSPGTVDPDFRGEAGILLHNHSDQPFTIEKNMRIAQMVFSKFEVPVFEEVESLPETKRGIGGFGSTGFQGQGIGTEDFNKKQAEADKYYMNMAIAAAENSRCIRGVKKVNGQLERNSKGELIGRTRKFGCIIVKDDNIIGHGFNDQYTGSSKCEKAGCLREELGIPSGTELEICRAMHAEWWAITSVVRTGAGSTKGAAMYITAEPCKNCAKIITGLGLEAVVVPEGVYPNNGLSIIKEAGINIRFVKI